LIIENSNIAGGHIMKSNWNKEIFDKLDNSPYNREKYQQFKPLLDILFGELKDVMTSLQGSENEADRERFQKYQNILTDWSGYVERIHSRVDTHFGYPMNLSKRSFLVDFFRIMESLDVNQNNFGDIMDISDIVVENDMLKTSRNNYALDIKSLEWDVVRLVAENLGIPEQPRLVEMLKNQAKYKDGFWGYVTSGGSESNLWGILQGFTEYPDGVLYFCEAAHYSISKAAKSRNCQVISQKSADDESIDDVALLEAIKTNWFNLRKPAIIVLTFGTTKFGSVDDVALIKKQLVELQIPHYLHVDAALYGGIPKNQTNAPKIGSLDMWGYDSVAISMHKYIGYPIAKGVLISAERPAGRFVDYVGQEDNTVLGSRDAHGFSLRQQVMEVFHHTEPNEYFESIQSFSDMLASAKVKFTQWSDGECKGNIFVFKVDKAVKGYQEICKRWQLSEFVGKDGFSRIHVVIFPSHSNENLQLLADDLSKIAVN